jgi:hypothetical protein
VGRRPTVAVVMLLALAAPVAQAQLTVRVRAESRIELRARLTAEGASVEGTLRDDLGAPLPGRAVRVGCLTEDGRSLGREDVRTDARGDFRHRFHAEGTRQVRAIFTGDDGYRRIEALQRLEPGRAHVRLDVRGPAGGRLDLDREVHDLAVEATSPSGGVGLEIEVLDEVGRTVAAGLTDAASRHTFQLRSADLGPPSAGRLVVRTAGDARRARAQTELPVVRFRSSALTMEAGVDEGRIRVAGQLADSQGPLPRRAVGIFVDGSHRDTVLTDDGGRFLRRLPAADLSGEVTVEARFASDAPWHTDARAEPVTLRLAPPRSAPWSWLLASIGISVGAAWWVGRTGRRPQEDEDATRPASAPGIEVGEPEGRLAAAGRRDVSGVVVDVEEGRRRIEAATVRLEAEGRIVAEACTDARGRFAFDDLPDGRFRLEVSAAGYAAESLPVSLPHRGGLSGLTVRLESLRRRALVIYRPVAEALTSPSRWLHATPRELLGRTSRPPALEALLRRVELALYGSAPLEETDLTRLAEDADRVQAALEEPAGGDVDGPPSRSL